MRQFFCNIALVIILIYNISCSDSHFSNNDETKTLQEPSENLQPADTVSMNDLYDKNFQDKSQELTIYPLSSYDKSENQPTGFIPLTDVYPWSDKKDSSAISETYLGNNKMKNFHVLDKKYRANFLKVMKIKESDTVFIYNYRFDSLRTFLVRTLPLLAHITVYGADPPIRQEDYVIGFDLENLITVTQEMGYYSAVSNIAAANPFQRGKMKPIIWEKIVPAAIPSWIKGKIYADPKIDSAFIFKMENLDYFLLNSNHLVIVNSSAKKVLSERLYNEGESMSPAILSFAESKYENYLEQWTGTLFKNKAPVFLGFLNMSFGCETIDFIEKPESRIYIRCDNRH